MRDPVAHSTPKSTGGTDDQVLANHTREEAIAA